MRAQLPSWLLNFLKRYVCDKAEDIEQKKTRLREENKLIFNNNIYTSQRTGEKYCPACFDDKARLIHLQEKRKNLPSKASPHQGPTYTLIWFECPACHNHY